jgi:hypothetical protein
LPPVSHNPPLIFMQFSQSNVILYVSGERNGRSRQKETKYMVKENNRQKMLKRGAAFTALALAAMIPLVSMAESTTQATQAVGGGTNTQVVASMGGRGRFGRMAGGFQVDISQLTDAQKAAYDSAVTLYEQVEDAVLKDLVAVNIVTQADVDAYTALRSAQKSLNELGQSGWTAEQYKAFYEANTKTGDERKAAMQALADAGQLTKDQADALSAQGETGLWAKISQNANTNSAIQTAIGTMRQALAQLNSTLRENGIEGMVKGMMFEGFQNGAGRMMQNRNGRQAGPQGGKKD